MTIKRTWLWAGAVVVTLAILYLPSTGVSVGQLLIFLLLLACPLMHFLGGHRHGAGGHRDASAGGEDHHHAGAHPRMEAGGRNGASAAPLESTPDTSVPEVPETTAASPEGVSGDGAKG